MGILDLVRRKSPVEKQKKILCEAYSQPEYRRQAMEKLLEIGTEEAYDALLCRFTFQSSGGIADEDEKSDLVDELVKIGQPAVPSVKKFIKSEKHISFPIRALAGILSREDLIKFLEETLRAYEPLDHRSTLAKTSLVMALADASDPAQAPVVLPYLGDHHDDVQFQVIVALEKFKNDAAREALCEVCVGDSRSARIQGRAAQALAELEWSVKDSFDRFNSEIKAIYLLGKKGYLVKKKQAEQPQT